MKMFQVVLRLFFCKIFWKNKMLINIWIANPKHFVQKPTDPLTPMMAIIFQNPPKKIFLKLFMKFLTNSILKNFHLYFHKMRKLLLSILSGILLVSSWATNGFPLLLFVSFVPLLYAFERVKKEPKNQKLKVFSLSFLTLFIFNFGTTFWLGYATLFGMFFAMFLNSFIYSFVFLFYFISSKKTDSYKSFLFLICLWICAEKFDMNWDFSWPWLTLGNGFSHFHKWVQWYEYTGVFGGTLWIWICNGIFFSALKNYRRKNFFLKKIILGISLIISGITISLLIYEKKIPPKNKTQVLLLQPNIDPYTTKYELSNLQVLDRLLHLTNSKIDSLTEFVIAPETTFAELINIDYFENSRIFSKIQKFQKKISKQHIYCRS